MINRALSDPLDEAIDRFEESWSANSLESIKAILAEFGLNGDEEALSELIRIDIELRYKNGIAIELDQYLDEFNPLLGNPQYVAQIAYEDYRSRLTHGHSVATKRWNHLPGIGNETWFQHLKIETSLANARARLARLESDAGPDAAFENALDEAGFRLIQEIGQGAMGHVYLATENELADRYVVLKIVTEPMAEPQNMALLQHTNIVPIYSVHQILSRSVICMPYAGRVTLKEFLDGNDAKSFRGGQSLVTTVQARVNDTKRIDAGDASENAADLQLSIPAADESEVLKPLEKLRSLDCGELATWMFARLTSALAHSHARGVLHNDLKPGNVLIRNDGEPALLDFNLSHSTGGRKAKYIGGTLPYMAPETYDRLLREDCQPQAAADLYAIGVMMFQFVTGRLPYQTPGSMAPIDLEPAIHDRKKSPNWSDADNVSPGLRAIINKCLAFNPIDRFANAEDLQQDLQREHHHLSLKHAAEPIGGRTRKLFRRHPAFASASSVGLLLLALFAPLGYKAVLWKNETQQLAAVTAFDAFSAESKEVLSMLAADPQQSDESRIQAGMEPLEQYGLLREGGFQRLVSPQTSEVDRERIRDAVALHLLQVALMESERLAIDSHGETLGPAELSQLRRLIDAAGRLKDSSRSRAVQFLKSSDARLAGDTELHQKLESMAAQLPATTDTEVYMEAMRLFLRYQFQESSELLASLSDNSTVPSTLRWTSLGRSQFRNNLPELAKLSFTQSIQRAPDLASLYVHRGLCHLKLYEGPRARADFTKAIELDPKNRMAWINRGSYHLGNRRYTEAIADFTEVLSFMPDNVHARLARARAYRNTGQIELADKEFDEAMLFDNLDVYSLQVRSQAREDSDPDGAVEDIDAALKMEPENPVLLRRMAHLLSRKFGRDAEAIGYYGKSISVDPLNEYGLVDRAVLLARAGEFGKANDDLENALQMPNSSRTLYQAACVYALMPETTNRNKALKHLSLAIRAGHDTDNLASDPDLESIRDTPGFQAISRMYLLSKIGPRRKT